MKTQQAIIAIGGKGTRLNRKENNIPKSMIQIDGHPIFYWTLCSMYKAGIKKIILASERKEDLEKAKESLKDFPYKFEQIIFFQDKGINADARGYQIRDSLDDTYLLECGHALNSSSYYQKLDAALKKNKVLFSAYRIRYPEKRLLVGKQGTRISLIEQPTDRSEEYMICTPMIMNKQYARDLAKHDFNMPELLRQYCSEDLIQIFVNNFPIEFNIPEEMEEAIKVYKDYIYNNLV